jgi:parallel beta-helix repeat protein
MVKKGAAVKGFFIMAILSALISANSCFAIETSGELLKKCSVLDTPGAYYLDEDIMQEGNGSCIIIKSENVALNCQGHSIIGSNQLQTSGIFSDIRKTKIEDCIIRGFENGIYLKNSNESFIVNNILTKNNLGVNIESSANVIVSLNKVNKNEKGFSFSGENGVISNNEICFNTEKDASCNSSQLFENNHCDSWEACGGICSPCTHKDNDVYNCRELNKSNIVYELRADINIYVPETCFFINSDNITLNGNGNSINYMFKYSSSGKFSIYSEKSNLTIKNIGFRGASQDPRYSGNAIKTVNSKNVNILNNSFENIKNAVFSQGFSEMFVINGNILKNLDGDGIRLESSDKSVINENKLESILGDGIYLKEGSENLVQNNKLISVRSKGIFIGKGNSSQLRDNYIEGSGNNSIEFMNDWGVIENNEILKSDLIGILLSDAQDSSVENNNINKMVQGIGVISTLRAHIKDNNIYEAAKGGISAENSTNAEIIGNNIGSSYFGFKEESSSDLFIYNNTFCGNNYDAVCSSSHVFNNNSCNSLSVCGGHCIECGKHERSLWEKIKEFFINLFG